MADTLKDIQKDFVANEYSLMILAEKFVNLCKTDMTAEERLTTLIKAAVELTTQEAPDWEFIAARLFNFSVDAEVKGTGRNCRYLFFL